jgi:hypothetical protein
MSIRQSSSDTPDLAPVTEKDVGSLPEATGFSILLALAPVTEKDVGSLPEATGFSLSFLLAPA